MPRFLLAMAAILSLSLALAAIGDAPDSILGELQRFSPSHQEGTTYLAGEEFRISFELRNGAVYAVEGGGALTEGNAELLSRLIAAATGYGDAIAGPVRTFLDTRIGEIAGQGRVSLGVEEYLLGLEVVGSSTPYEVEFRLSLQELPADAFPEARHALGPSDARFVVREFSDFQCPFCARFALQALPAIRERLLERGDVRFEYHHFPLQSIHANAAPAAEASECVAEVNGPESFWDFHDALFERQQAWQGLGDPVPYFVRLAADVGLATEGVEGCLRERRYADEVQEAYLVAARTLGLTGTPSVFVNGYRVQDYLDPHAYLELIELARTFGDEE